MTEVFNFPFKDDFGNLGVHVTIHLNGNRTTFQGTFRRFRGEGIGHYLRY